MEIPKAYTLIAFGAMDVAKACESIRFGAMEVAKAYAFMGFGAFLATMHLARRTLTRTAIQARDTHTLLLATEPHAYKPHRCPNCPQATPH